MHLKHTLTTSPRVIGYCGCHDKGSEGLGMGEKDEPRQWIISLFYYQELTYVLRLAGL